MVKFLFESEMRVVGFFNKNVPKRGTESQGAEYLVEKHTGTDNNSPETKGLKGRKKYDSCLQSGLGSCHSCRTIENSLIGSCRLKKNYRSSLK